jgi:hypothetical protein
VLAASAPATAGTVGGVAIEIAASVPSVLNVILNGLIEAVNNYQLNLKLAPIFLFVLPLTAHLRTGGETGI